MIGGLLRFAPGRLGARQDRAPSRCGNCRWVGSWLSCLTPATSWTPEARTGRVSLVVSGRDGNRQRVTRAMRQPWLAEIGMEEGRLLSPAGVTADGWCGGRATRLRVWPCPSPSRIFDRYAAPSASLTASLWHGIGRWRGRPGACLSPTPRSPVWPGVSSVSVPPVALQSANHRELAMPDPQLSGMYGGARDVANRAQ